MAAPVTFDVVRGKLVGLNVHETLGLATKLDTSFNDITTALGELGEDIEALARRIADLIARKNTIQQQLTDADRNLEDARQNGATSEQLLLLNDLIDQKHIELNNINEKLASLQGKYHIILNAIERLKRRIGDLANNVGDDGTPGTGGGGGGTGGSGGIFDIGGRNLFDIANRLGTAFTGATQPGSDRHDAQAEEDRQADEDRQAIAADYAANQARMTQYRLADQLFPDVAAAERRDAARQVEARAEAQEAARVRAASRQDRLAAEQDRLAVQQTIDQGRQSAAKGTSTGGYSYKKTATKRRSPASRKRKSLNTKRSRKRKSITRKKRNSLSKITRSARH
jgi:hypothetical protein